MDHNSDNLNPSTGDQPKPNDPNAEPTQSLDSVDDYLEDLPEEEDIFATLGEDDIQSSSPDDADDLGLDDENDMLEQRAQPSSGLLADLFRKPWFFYGVIGIVLIIGGYFILSSLFPSHHHSAPVQHNSGLGFATPTNRPIQQVTHVTHAQPVAHTNSLMLTQSDFKSLLQGFQNVVTSQNTVLADQLKRVEAQLAKDQEAYASLEKLDVNSVKSLQKTLAHLSKNISHNHANMSKLASTLTETQSELKLLVAERAQTMQKLTLRAIVPGRAWLVNGKGQTITITQGESIPYYGKIVSIDANAGTVKTSSGYVFD